MRPNTMTIIAVGVILIALIVGAASMLESNPEKTGMFALHFATTAPATRSIIQYGVTNPSTIDADRDFNVRITLTLGSTASNTYYVVDESYPTGFTVTNAGGGDNNAILKKVYWVKITGVSPSSTYQINYTLHAPATPGTYTINGGHWGTDDNNGTTSPASTSITVVAVNLCANSADGNYQNSTQYCCGHTLVSKPTNCATGANDCNFLGPSPSSGCCSGTSAVCCAAPNTRQCGTLNCPANRCVTVGSNNVNNFLELHSSATCSLLCTGTALFCPASCTTPCSWLANKLNCGTASYCQNNTNACTTCTGDLRNCDSNSLNGCEINTLNNNNNCGSCGNVCPAFTSCYGLACSDDDPVCREHPNTPSNPWPTMATIPAETTKWTSGQLTFEQFLLKIKIWHHCVRERGGN